MSARARTVVEPAELGRLVSLAEAAERLSVCDRTLRRMIDRRQVRAVRIGHGRGVWRIPETEVARLISEGSIPV